MTQQQFIKMLAKLKQQYLSKSIAMKTMQLSVEDIAQLLYRYMKIQPFVLKEMLFKSTGKFNLCWDDLLSFLEEDIAIKQEVQKIQISTLSASQIIERYTNEFTALIAYVRLKETNQIQHIQKLTASLNQNMYAVCLQKQLIFYDESLSKIVNSLYFKYSNLQDFRIKKQVIKEQTNRKKQREEELNEKFEQLKDKVGEMKFLQRNKTNNSKQNKSLTGMSNTIKSSGRVSEFSSDKSKQIDKMLFKNSNDSGINKRKFKSKSNFIKIKNDDVGKVFQYFKQASINNSIQIAKAFTQARSNFNNHIILDQNLLDKDKASINLEISSAHLHKNFNKQLQHLRRDTKSIEIVRIAKSVDINNLANIGRSSHKKSKYSQNDFNIKAVKKKINIQKTVLDNKMLSIVTFHIFENYLVISLFNRQLRLFHLAKSLNKICEQLIFERHFDSIISYVRMYKCQNQNKYRMALVAQKQNKAQFIVYHLDQTMNPSKKSFHLDIPFSAKCDFFLPFGASLYNQLGYFYIVQFNNLLSLQKEKHTLSTRLYDSSQHTQISISQVVLHKNIINFYLSCQHGSIYNYNRYSNSIQSSVKLCQTHIHNIILIKDSQQLLALYGHGNMIILSTINLNKIYVHHSYNQFMQEPKLLLPDQRNLFVYSSRNINSYLINENDDRKFNNVKPLKILKSRLKIRLKDKIIYKNSKQNVLKVIFGCGGQGDFIALVLQTGQIMILGSNLEYIGSYHYLRVSSILNIVSNKSNQFIALLIDNNTIQIVNLYTQKVIFSINSLENQRQVGQKIGSSSLGMRQKMGFGEKTKQKKKGKAMLGQTIKLMSFMSGKQAQTFFAYVGSNNYVHHYSQKGSLLQVINLQQRSRGDITNLSNMLYIDEQLVIVKNENLIILHRKSYNRKYMMKVSKRNLSQIKRSNYGTLCAIDVDFNMFLVNIHNQDTKCLYKQMRNDIGNAESLLFNQKIRIRLFEERIFVMMIGISQEHSFKIQQQTQCIALLNENILKINKVNNKIYRYNISTSQFQQICL